MSKKNILKKIDEAIASEETTEFNRELLIEIKEKLEKAKTTQDIAKVVLKVLELFGAVIGAFNSG
ncbi:hypothetical protein [Flagellimonas aurea]|uniref:hypothetical protein n=1 Tax=Flagellimonas aurea TaxID=2915619 RepID=UPI0035CE8F46